MKEENLTNTLDRVIKDTHFTYRGCWIERMIGGYKWNNQKFTSYIELDKAIDETLTVISNSIKKGK